AESKPAQAGIVAPEPAEVAAVARHRQRTAVAVDVVRALESADPAHGSCSVGSKQGAGVPGQARWDWAVATATSRRCAWPGEDVVMRAGKLARSAARPDSGRALQRSRQSLAPALA